MRKVSKKIKDNNIRHEIQTMKKYKTFSRRHIFVKHRMNDLVRSGFDFCLNSIRLQAIVKIVNTF